MKLTSTLGHTVNFHLLAGIRKQQMAENICVASKQIIEWMCEEFYAWLFLVRMLLILSGAKTKAACKLDFPCLIHNIWELLDTAILFIHSLSKNVVENLLYAGHLENNSIYKAKSPI